MKKDGRKKTRNMTITIYLIIQTVSQSEKKVIHNAKAPRLLCLQVQICNPCDPALVQKCHLFLSIL